MLSQLWAMGQLAVGAILIAALSVELARRPIVIAYGLLGLYAWSLVYTGELMATRIAGLHVDVIDVVNIIAFGATLIRMRRGPRRWQWALLGAVVLTVYAALRGAIDLGGTALLGFRAELYFVVPALFVATLSRSMISRVVRAIVVLGVVLAVIAVGRWIALATGLAPLASSGAYAIERVINSTSALWVSFASIAGLMALLKKCYGVRRWVSSVVTGPTLLVVLFSQHRSVWVAAVTMLAVALIGTRQRWYMKAAMIIAASVGVLGIASLGPDDVGVVGESLAVAASNVGTWEWRLQRWEDVWTAHAARGVPAIIFGTGYGYAWVSGAVGVWEVSPHNGYLQIAVRLGLLGAILVFWPHLAVLLKLWSATDAVSRVLWLWIIGSLVYYVPYSANPLTGVVLGASVVLLLVDRESAVAAAWESRVVSPIPIEHDISGGQRAAAHQRDL